MNKQEKEQLQKLKVPQTEGGMAPHLARMIMERAQKWVKAGKPVLR